MREPDREQRVPGAARLRQHLARLLFGDPRRIVAFVSLLIVALGAAGTLVMTTWMDRTERSVHLLAQAIADPKDHLLAAGRANDEAQTALLAAAGSTGDQRAALLSEAVIHSQQMATEWRNYQATAVGLPGEADLAAQYVEHQKASQAASTAALVPILNATVAGPLPPAELEAHAAVRADLIALHSMYRLADRRALATLNDETNRAQQLLSLGVVVTFGLVLGGIGFGMRMAARSIVDRAERSGAERLASFEARLRRALELIDEEADAFVVAERALGEMMPGVQASVLTADSSRARLTPLGALPTCGVSTPGDCPALRSGSTVTVVDSGALDACRTLARNASHACSATCVPVTITGRGAAVMHLVGPAGHPPDSRGAVDLIARSVGDRVTLLQALATFQLQAERDPLTGLLNRRSLENAVDGLLTSGRRYSVAFADLDHFKQINDLHGHEAGDRSLRSFARTLRDSVRPNDLTCRWGGEEFLVALPDGDAALAIDAMERVRTNLALGSMSGQTTVVTASFGVADSTEARTFEDVVARSDTALRQAKDAGRNRVVHLGPLDGTAEMPTDAHAAVPADLPAEVPTAR